MNEANFHKCFSYWRRNFKSDETYRLDVLDRDGVIKIMWFEAMAQVKSNDPYNRLNSSWKKIEHWLRNDAATAPSSVNKFYHSGSIWWWKDTQGQMLSTALGAALITILFSAAVVLISSKSLRLSLFACLSISYILAAATASLAGMGWTLGFLESVCFVILIGISCDFVVHFGHAYIFFEGFHTKEERTKHATIHMGPSILAAAMTTFSAAIVMIFCTLKFFTLFSEMLLLTITHAIIGSFIVYLVLCETFGPAEPTKLYSHFCTKKTRTNDEVNNNQVSYVPSFAVNTADKGGERMKDTFQINT
jgi:5-methyltetrahydrofolate--homocysteine methyltransferase